MRALALAGSATALLVTASIGCGPSASSSGCKDKLLPGDLVITEVFADAKAPPGGSGTDEGKEWFEIYNAADRPVELKGLTITHSRPDGTKAASHVMDDVTIAPGQFFTLGNTTPDLLAPYIDYGYSADLGDMFNTDGGKLRLACGDSEIDSATYEAVKEGHSRQLTNAQPPDYTINDNAANWCQANDAEFDTANFGTPGSDNDCAPVVIGQCSDGGTMRDAVPPAPGDLVITEVMPKPKAVSATTGQWFEVLALKDLDLNGVGLDRAGDSASPTLITATDCIHMTAGSYAVFARSADMAMNGGLTTLATFPFSINPTGTPDVQLVYGTEVIDAVSWTTSTTGKSLSLDPDAATATGNDSPSNFCDGVAVYNTVGPNMDLGTPGAANAQCATVPGPGQCLDNGTLRSIVKPAAGQLVVSEFLANPAGTGTDTTQEWIEVTNSGAAAFDLNGLGLKGNTTTVNTIQSADCKPVAAGGFALFAHGTDTATNGGLPPVDATFTFALAASNGSLSVLDGATVLDAVTWTTPAIGDGVGKQLKPTNTNVTDNDSQANFCDGKAAQMYGTAANFGTPKAANVCL